MTYEIAQRARRRTQLVIAGVIVLVMVVVAGTVALANVFGGGGGPTAGPASQTGAPPSAAPPAPGIPAQRVAPDARASSLTWVNVQGVALPVSAEHGPRSYVDGRGWGFARTDRGAGLAAVHIMWATGGLVSPRVFRPTIERQTFGPDKAAFLASVQTRYDAARIRVGVPPGEPIGRSEIELRGYRIAGQPTDEYLTVHVLFASTSAAARDAGLPALSSAPVTLAWLDEDWKAMAPAAGWAEAPVSPGEPFTPLDEEQ